MKKSILWLNLLLLPFTPFLQADIHEEEQPVLVLGGGVAALTSAVYLSRSGIPPVVITGPVVGGTITQSLTVQNWPGEMEISGFELGDKLKTQAEANGAQLRQEVVLSVDFSKRPYIVTTQKVLGSDEEIHRYKAQAIIIAMGAAPNLLQVPGETGPKGYWSRGVYNCAVCDGSLYKDKVVSVIGGGDSAILEAQYLCNIASKVHIFVRRDQFRTIETQRLKELLTRPNIEVHYNTQVKEIRGDGEKATHLLAYDSAQDKFTELPTDALFLAIGARPNTELFRNQLELDPSGYIVLKKHQQTSQEGIYAIGDVADPEFKQAISAAGDGAKAAIQAQQYLSSKVALPSVLPIAKHEKKTSTLIPIEVRSKSELEKCISEASGPIFIDFYATYCGPCRSFAPLYEEWAKLYGDRITFLKVNADHARALFETYQIRAVPTLLILDNRGQILRRSIGSKEITDVNKRLYSLKDVDTLSPHDFK
jgi:thioredoxin reductase (NADPH)